MRRTAQASAPRTATVWDKQTTTDAVAAAASAVIATPPVAVPGTRRSARTARIATVTPVVPSADEAPIVETLVFDDEVVEPIGDAPAAPADEQPQPHDETSADAEDSASFDEFEAAARLFSFTAETPVQTAPIIDENDAAFEDIAAHVASSDAKPRGASFKRLATASFSVGVFGVVGLLTIGLTTPVEAVAAAGGTTASMSVVSLAGTDATGGGDEIQAYVTPEDLSAVDVSRSENYATETLAQVASDEGITYTSDFFTNDPNAAIQWPFSVGVPISSGFGSRWGRMHEGVDFVPGLGSPVQAIADGTVRIATENGGAYGVTVVIDHVIDGALVSTRYGHMQYGSLLVSPGQKVTVGTQIGSTGNTGRSTGPHMHFEVLLGGTTAVDPIPWLRAHAGG